MSDRSAVEVVTLTPNFWTNGASALRWVSIISGICLLNVNRAEEKVIGRTCFRACDWRDSWNEAGDPANAEVDWKVKDGLTVSIRSSGCYQRKSFLQHLSLSRFSPWYLSLTPSAAHLAMQTTAF